jgi:hypothetical protein
VRRAIRSRAARRAAASDLHAHVHDQGEHNPRGDDRDQNEDETSNDRVEIEHAGVAHRGAWSASSAMPSAISTALGIVPPPMSAAEPEPTIPHPRLALFGRSPSGFSNAVTIGLSLFLAGFLFLVSMATRTLERPIDTAIRIFERDLEIDDGLQRMPAWSHAMLAVRRRFGHRCAGRGDRRVRGTDRGQGTAAARRAGSAHARARSRARRAARATRRAPPRSRAARERARKISTSSRRTGHQSFVDALNVAYSSARDADGAHASGSFDVSIAGDGLDRPARATAARERDARRGGARATRRRNRRARGTRHAQDPIIGAAYLVPLALGLAALLVWLARNRPETVRANAPITAALVRSRTDSQCSCAPCS